MPEHTNKGGVMSIKQAQPKAISIIQGEWIHKTNSISISNT